mgnify:FL=1
MKSLKKYFKVILCFMAFAVASFLFAIAPTMGSFYALEKTSTDYNMAIKAVKMPRSTFVDAEKNQSLRVPLLKENSTWQTSAKYTIRVIDPSFTAHDYKVGSSEAATTEEGYFTKIKVDGDTVVKEGDEGYDAAAGDEYISISALNNGKYDIVYIMEEGSKLLYSDTYSVTVENVSYTLDFAQQAEGANKGLKTLLPEKVAKSATNKLELPVASVKNSEGAYVSNTGVTLKVFDAYGKQLSTEDTDSVFKYEDGKYYLYTSVEGKFTVEYSYAFGNNPPKKSFTVEVEKDYVAPTSADLSINIPTMPNVELGQKDITLPDVVVNNAEKDDVEHNVKSIVISNKDGSITRTLTNNDFKFSMTKEFFDQTSYTTAMLGDWYVEYTIEDAYKNTKSIKVTIDGVKDNTKPEVFMAYDYELDENGNPKVDKKGNPIVDTSVATELKNQYGYNELNFPAIYATDAVTDYKDFIFVRYIQSTRTSTIYYLDNVMIKDGAKYTITAADTELASQMNAAGENANIGTFNKAVKFEFNLATEEEKSNMAGEYTLGYYVLTKDITKQDSYLYVSNTTMYTFNILGTPTRGTTTDVEHTVEINNIKENYSVASDGKFSVNITAKETKRGDSTTNADKRLKTAVFYYYETSSSNLLQDLQNAFAAASAARGDSVYGSKHLIETDEFKNAMSGYTGFKYATQTNKNTFEVQLEDYNNSENAYLVAFSIDDDGNIAVTRKTLKIKNMNDVDAPANSILTVEGYAAEESDKKFSAEDMTNLVVRQGDVVSLPDIAFEDNDKSLRMSVVYYINTPENSTIGMDYKTPTNKVYKNNINGKSVIYGGKIKTTEVGTYHVIYSASDDAGNTTYVYLTFEVKLASEPELKITYTGDFDADNSTANNIVGETGMKLVFDPTLWTKGESKEDITNKTGVTISYTVEDNGNKWESGDDDNSFVFIDEGKYTITYTATYQDGAETFTAEKQTYTVNVTRPELKWNETINESDYAYAPKGSVVTLPDLSASQGEEKAKVTLKVTFKGDEQPVTKKTENNSTVWQFTTSSTLTGDYKVEYTATTKYSKITKSLTIKVGDNVPPVITIDHEEDLSQELIYDGKTNIEYKINLVKTSTSTRERKLEIVITNGDTVKTYNTNLSLTDKDETGAIKNMNWDTLTVELKNGDSTMSTSSSDTYSKTYTISSTGEYKLVIKATDSNTNTGEKEIKFKVTTKTDVEKKNDTVVGVVLIVLSLVVLAGVILFFALTGKGKGGSNKAKSNKQPKTKTTEVKEETTEVEKVEDTDAKSGDVE